MLPGGHEDVGVGVIVGVGVAVGVGVTVGVTVGETLGVGLTVGVGDKKLSAVANVLLIAFA